MKAIRHLYVHRNLSLARWACSTEGRMTKEGSWECPPPLPHTPSPSPLGLLSLPPPLPPLAPPPACSPAVTHPPDSPLVPTCSSLPRRRGSTPTQNITSLTLQMCDRRDVACYRALGGKGGGVADGPADILGLRDYTPTREHPPPPGRASTERCLRITLSQTTEKCPGFIYLFQVYQWFFATPMCA